MRLNSNPEPWSLHEGGHCRIDHGIDAIFEPPTNASNYIKGIGPFPTLDNTSVHLAMYELTKQIERQFDKRSILIWGDLSNSNHGTPANFLGQSVLWKPDPLKRTRLVSAFSSDLEELAPEWNFERSGSVAMHCSGISVDNSQGQIITMHNKVSWYPEISLTQETSIVSMATYLLENYCNANQFELPTHRQFQGSL